MEDQTFTLITETGSRPEALVTPTLVFAVLGIMLGIGLVATGVVLIILGFAKGPAQLVGGVLALCAGGLLTALALSADTSPREAQEIVSTHIQAEGTVAAIEHDPARERITVRLQGEPSWVLQFDDDAVLPAEGEQLQAACRDYVEPSELAHCDPGTDSPYAETMEDTQDLERAVEPFTG